MKRADLAEGRAVKLARRVVQPMDAVGQAGLLQRPLDSKVFRFADPLTENPAKAIERDRACLPSLNELKMPRSAGAGAAASACGRRRNIVRHLCRLTLIQHVSSSYCSACHRSNVTKQASTLLKAKNFQIAVSNFIPGAKWMRIWRDSRCAPCHENKPRLRWLGD